MFDVHVFVLQKIEGPFLRAVKETLDDRYTENMENIYKMTIRFILETVIAGYEAAESDNQDKSAEKPL